MRWAAVAVLLLVPLLGGCLSVLHKSKHVPGPGEAAPADLGYDPDAVRVTGVEKASYTIASFDETNLATVVYAPVSADTLPDGSPPRWGVVVFLHGWGDFKEQYEGIAGATGAPLPADPTGLLPYTNNRLEEFAHNGLIAVAYDARGFGQSGGMASVAGPAEMADLDAVIDYVAAHYPTNGLVGVVGQSYGGGQAYEAWASDPRVTTVVPMYGWVDLYQGVLQGNVPKAEWAALLVAGGAVGSKAQMSPMVGEWVQKAATRTDLATVKAQMDLRSVLPRMGSVTRPLLICQGMQETLFPQADLAWQAAGGFTRAVIVTGGHGTDDPLCWSKALSWFLYFLGGHDTGVAKWPALTTVDAADPPGATLLDYPKFPAAAWRTFYLREPTLANDPSNTSFTVSQRVFSNPIEEPSWLWDQTNQPTNAIPNEFRRDGGGVFFDTPPFTGSQVLLGAPVVHLKLVGSPAAAYQITGVLYHVDAANKSQIISRGAVAVLGPEDVHDGTVDLRLWWTKATLQPNDRVVLKLDANDQAVWLPLQANYDITFSGSSELVLPFFEG